MIRITPAQIAKVAFQQRGGLFNSSQALCFCKLPALSFYELLKMFGARS